MKQLFAHIRMVDEKNGEVKEANMNKEPDYLIFWFPRSYESFSIESIDYDKEEVKLTYPKVTLKSGQQAHFEHYNYHLDVTIDFRMEDDGVPCNEDTLYIHLLYLNYGPDTSESATYDLPYRVGAKTPDDSYYKVEVKELNKEEVVLSANGHDFKVQLHKSALRNDKYGIPTGAPNDPVDYVGPSLTMELKRKDQKEEA